MCGICGHTDDPDAALTGAMSRALRHRGPDDDGVYTDPRTGVSLGARRLSIIDVAHGHQPIANEDETVWAVLNGEIYNHPELWRQLRSAGHVPRSACDTEVLVHLYEDYGADLVHALEGMFAFAIWDTRRQRLVLGRDRFGEKPLFYDDRGGQLRFASELSGLVRGLDSVAVAPRSVDACFVLGYVPGPDSMLEGVSQLPPGSVLEWHADTATHIHRYWSPPTDANERAEPRRELELTTEALLRDAVQSRMVSDVPLGAFLSGGIDSSLIAAVASQLSTTQLKTFSVGYDVGDVDETDKAAAIARQLGTDHHTFRLGAADVAELTTGLLGAIDQPLADQALVAMHGVARFAREHVTVVIGGEGADEVFGGYPRYRWMKRSQALDGHVPRSLRGLAASAFSARADEQSARVADVLRPQGLGERNLDWVTSGRRRWRERLFGPRLRDAELDPDLAMAPAGFGMPGDAAGRLMRFDQVRWLPDDVLAKADRSGMLASLEVRTPFLERRLVEFAASVPAQVHLANGGKSLLRGVVKRSLPSVASAQKTAFRVPADDWLRGPLRPHLVAQIEGSRLFDDGWFDRVAVAALVDEHLNGRADRAAILWPIFTIGSWLDGWISADGR